MSTDIHQIYLITVVATEDLMPANVKSIEFAVFDANSAILEAVALHSRIATCNRKRKKFVADVEPDFGPIYDEAKEFEVWSTAPMLGLISPKEFRYSFYDPAGICVKKFDGERFHCACNDLGLRYHPLVFELF